MNSNNDFSPEKSLKIIDEMIGMAKVNLRENAFYFLLWGWITIIGCFLNFIFLKFTIIEKPYRVWLIVIAGVIINIIYGARQSKKRKFTTHLTKIYSFMWMTFGISLLIITLFLGKLNYQIFPLLFILLGNGTFLSGIILKFTPLILGGIFFWISSVLTFYIPYEYHLLLSAITGIVAYLIPGYMLKNIKN